ASFPEGQAGEVRAREVLGECEGGRRDLWHVAPVLDPASRLGRRPHGKRRPRAAPRGGTTPDQRARRQPGEGPPDRADAGHRVGQRRRHATRPQECIEAVLVLAQLDDPRPREKEPARDPGPAAGKDTNLRVAGRDEQVDPLLLDDAGDGPGKPGMVEAGYQVVAIRLRSLGGQSIAMTSDDDRGAAVALRAPV